MSEDNNPLTQAAILKELSDMKSLLAVNTNETANIKSSVVKIENAIDGITNNYVTWREFTEKMKDAKDKNDAEIRILKEKATFSYRVIVGIFSVIGTAFLIGLIRIFTK